LTDCENRKRYKQRAKYTCHTSPVKEELVDGLEPDTQRQGGGVWGFFSQEYLLLALSNLYRMVLSDSDSKQGDESSIETLKHRMQRERILI